MIGFGGEVGGDVMTFFFDLGFGFCFDFFL